MKYKQYKTGWRGILFPILVCLLSCGPFPVPEQPPTHGTTPAPTIETTTSTPIPTPLPWSDETKISRSDGSYAYFFGSSVYLFEDTIIIGSPGEQIGFNLGAGSTYIYTLDQTIWTGQQLTASDGQFFDSFGQSVSISGNNIIIGASCDNNGTDSGAVYLFTRTGETWTEQKYAPAYLAENDEFGYDVDISGDYAIVGAPGRNNETNPGAAYIFYSNGTGWEQQQELLPEDIVQNGNFGYSVSISDGHAIVGAPENEYNGINSGTIYSYAWNGTTWVELGNLVPGGATASDRFGASVYISGDYAIIGAPYASHNGTSSSGAAYIFHRTGFAWIEIRKLTASDGEEDDHFGSAVSLYGDYAVVGSPENDDTVANSGAVYIFYFDGSTWTELRKLTGTDVTENAYFGSSVNISENYIVVGAPYDNNEFGSVYIYEK